MKKKILAVLLTGVMVMSLTACGGSTEEAPSDGGQRRQTRQLRQVRRQQHPRAAIR